MTPHQYPNLAIKRAKEQLFDLGKEVKSTSWQSTESPDSTWELLNFSTAMVIPEKMMLWEDEVRPNQPWADTHFAERVGGKPVNPPPSHTQWPFAQKDNEKFTNGEKKIFDHTYPERFWPKRAGEDRRHHINQGIRFEYGDYEDVISLLWKDPLTRQAYLPIFFPEDTGSVRGQRIPCTLGYWFAQRNGYLHITYHMRSCDIIRHFRDDIFLAGRLVYNILTHQRRRQLSPGKDIPSIDWTSVKPGTLTIQIGSLHCFNKEKGLLTLDKT